jgi:hypothetical protein
MAEDGALAVGEQGRPPDTIDVEAGVTHGIDAPVHPIQPPVSKPVLDARTANPQSAQLMSTHHVVLALRKRRNSPIRRELRAFCGHLTA